MGYIEIPPDRLDPDLLRAVLEEFINREGTDYGEFERTMEEKTQTLHNQLQQGDVCIVFDPDSETCTLIKKEAITSIGREK